SGAGVSASWVPSSNAALQEAPQSIPEGTERTLPCPSRKTATRCCGLGRVNAATTAASASSVSAQGSPLHAPPHPANTAPLSGTAVRPTLVPFSNPLVQAPPATPPPRAAPAPPAGLSPRSR